MPTLKDYQNTDELNNPSNKTASDLIQGEHDAIDGYDRANDGLDDHPISRGVADGTDTGQNIRAVDQGEQQPPDVADKYGWGNSEGSPEAQSRWARLTGFIKRKGAGIAAGGGILGVLLLFMSLVTPFMIFQQMIETFEKEFNDQLSALEIRSAMLLKKKYDSKLTKNCTASPLPCKYQTMRDGSGLHKRLKAAGIEVEGDRSLVPGRIKPTAFVYDGKRIEAKDLLKEAVKDPTLKAALRKGYDPLYASFSDGRAATIRAKLGLKRSSSVESSTDKDKMNEDLKKVASRTDELPADGKPLQAHTNKEGVEGYIDGDGNFYDKAAGERINQVLRESVGRAGLAEKASKTILKTSVKSALTVTAMGAGAVDGLCSAWTMIRVAGYAAKYYQSRQVISYYYEFAKVAHKQRWGDLTAEEMEFYANKLTQTNSEGKAALDSAGYRYAAYGDVFQPASFAINEEKSEAARDAAADKIMLQNESSRYVNGQLLNDNMMSDLVRGVTGGESTEVRAADKVCKFTKSWKGQALVFGAAIAGVAVAILSGGASLGPGLLLGAAASVSITVAMALIQPKLIDMAKGEVIKGDENGNETGNALASGAGAFNAQTAQRRGLRPATNEAYAQYSEKSQEIAAQLAEDERAQLSPFDTSSRNTFLGSMVFQLLPYISKQQSFGSMGVGLLSLVGKSFTIIGSAPTVSAAEGGKYEQCDDHEYKGIAADPYCNLRYAATNVEKDPEEVLQFMIDGNFIDPQSGAPGTEYQDYIAKCIDRETSIGDEFTDYKDGISENGGDAGEQCVIGRGGGNEYRNAMFALFHIDTTIEEGMENDYPDSAGLPAPTVSAGEFTVATYNILHADHHTDKSKAIGGCAANPVPDDPTCGKTRAALQAQIITGASGDNPAFDIFGTQETSPRQHAELRKLLPDYDTSPTETSRMNNADDGAVSVFWNKSKFTKVSEGKAPGMSNTSKQITNPWVGLQTSSGHMIYVMSIHYAVTGYGGTPENIRKSAELTADWVKSKIGDNTTVLVVGDFNDQPSQKLSHCVLTKNSLMIHAVDLEDKKDPAAGCEKVPRYNGIDHIYSTPTPGLTAKGWRHPAQEGIYRRASDHSPSYTVYSMAGEEGSATGPTVDGWMWPIPIAESKAGPCYGGSSVHAGLDINSDKNSTVYAMHAGKVVRVIDGVTGDSPATGNHIMIQTPTGVYYGYQHLQNGSITVKQGDTVSAGQSIAKMGKTGNVSLGSSATHLHVTMATTNTTGSYGSLSTTFDPMKYLTGVKPAGYNCT